MCLVVSRGVRGCRIVTYLKVNIIYRIFLIFNSKFAFLPNASDFVKKEPIMVKYVDDNPVVWKMHYKHFPP